LDIAVHLHCASLLSCVQKSLFSQCHQFCCWLQSVDLVHQTFSKTHICDYTWCVTVYHIPGILLDYNKYTREIWKQINVEIAHFCDEMCNFNVHFFSKLFRRHNPRTSYWGGITAPQ